MLLILTVVNIIQIFGIDLSHDEAYYWIYSQKLSWGYYDHPPMVALFIKLGTFLFGDNEFGVRSIFNLATIVSLWLTFRMSKSKNTLLFITLLFSFPLLQASGFLALPDTCVLFFSTLYFYYLKKYLNEDKPLWWGLLSLSIAGMLYSKYHAGLIIILTLIALPKLFKKKSFYLITLFSFFLFLPHLYWQYQNEFVTFKFHLFKRKEKHFDIKNIFDFLGGQIALTGFLASFILYFKLFKYEVKSGFEKVLKYQILGFIIFLTLLSLRNKIEANWTLTLFVPFLILAGQFITKTKTIVLAALPLALICIVVRIILLLPTENIPIPRLLEFHGWKDISEKVISSCEGNKIVANEYQLASKLSFYTKLDIKALHLSGRKSQFSLMPKEDYGVQEKLCLITFSKMTEGSFIANSYPSKIYSKIGTFEELLKIEK